MIPPPAPPACAPRGDDDQRGCGLDQKGGPVARNSVPWGHGACAKVEVQGIWKGIMFKS